MKIALLGYGKMGKAIEKMAQERGHSIVAKLETDITDDFNFGQADIAIDFSIPQAAFKNITTAFKKGIPVVSGTTGWLDKYDKVVEVCKKYDEAFIYASNFSLGVNLFFDLNKKLARLMQNFEAYQVTIEETHHTQKKDAPSGTAISLAEQVIDNSSKEEWSLENPSDTKNINIKANRLPEVPGTHWVNYTSNVDQISIKHEAYNRQGFALGAVIAAEWLVGKKGVFTMNDVLNIG